MKYEFLTEIDYVIDNFDDLISTTILLEVQYIQNFEKKVITHLFDFVDDIIEFREEIDFNYNIQLTHYNKEDATFIKITSHSFCY
jgi:hypothetical protein